MTNSTASSSDSPEAQSTVVYVSISLFIYLASPNKKTTHTHGIIRQGDHYSLANYSGSHVPLWQVEYFLIIFSIFYPYSAL